MAGVRNGLNGWSSWFCCWLERPELLDFAVLVQTVASADDGPLWIEFTGLLFRLSRGLPPRMSGG